MVPDAREMTFPTLLDMEPPVVKAYSIETIVAEKFEASLDLAELNSRMKDFYDIWMLSPHLLCSLVAHLRVERE